VGEDFSGEVDYLVVGGGGGKGNRVCKQCVSVLWLEDCLNEGRLLNVEYYHEVISVELKPLKGVVVSLSGYAGSEREYLKNLVQFLGGVSQEVLARRDNPVEGVKAVTHLVCKEGRGEKFEAAMKWDEVLVVRHEWILRCLKELAWVSEDKFKVRHADKDKTSSVSFKRKSDQLVPKNNNSKHIDVLNNNVKKTSETVVVNASVQEQISGDIAKMEELMESFSTAPCVKRPRKVMKTVLSSVDLDARLPMAATEENVDEEEVLKSSQIIWVDPQEAVERDKLLTQLNQESHQ